MQNLNIAFSALSDPTRRAIIARLVQGDATVGELAAPFSISAPAVSRHLKVLEVAGLITNVREAKSRRCHLRQETLLAARDWLNFSLNFWITSLDRLETRFEEPNTNDKI